MKQLFVTTALAAALSVTAAQAQETESQPVPMGQETAPAADEPLPTITPPDGYVEGEVVLTTENLQGATVYDASGDEIGEVHGLVFANGSTSLQGGDAGAAMQGSDAATTMPAPGADTEVPDAATETTPAAPPPASDAEAQQLEAPVEVQSLREEEGRRVERREERRERREGADVLREIGDRLVIQLGNHAVVQSDDRGRLERDASEVYYEELPRGRTRETVVRPNGVQVVTIRDRYGDVVRRSRIMPDGREYVLVYAGDDRGREERRGWRDPGLDLPPLRLSIPAEDYILDAGRVDDPRAYYDFLDQPPVERVRRLYSVDEVRYSARVRDSVRRIDLDTITFDFGSASISEDAIPRLEALAGAMERLLGENPAETFLIEGHTDAVGSDLANLALSDRRAEAIAAALTNVFGIPPENLVTQGYGERYLKVNTQEPERENRRVAVRRITPLVAPVAGR